MRHLPPLTLLVVLFLTAAGCGSGENDHPGATGAGSGGSPAADGGTGAATSSSTGGAAATTGTGEYGSDATLYLVAKDTGQWHILADFLYNGAGNPASLYGPTVDPRIVPGTYDVYYCHNCATAGATVPIADETDAADALPNGLRILRACATVP